MADQLPPPKPEADSEAALPASRRYAHFHGLMLGTVAMIVGVFVLLTVVERPGSWQPNLANDPTPFGYSIGMAIYLVPMLAGLFMLRQLRSFALYQKTLIYAVVGMFIPIFVIDVLFVGSSFFHFPNCGAYLGYIGAFDLVDWEWEAQSVPIEDVAFYFLAIACTLVVYIWASLFWFPQASPFYRNGRIYPPRAWAYIKVWHPEWRAVVIGAVLIGLGGALQYTMAGTCDADMLGSSPFLERFCQPDSHSAFTCIDGSAVPIKHDSPTEAPVFPIYWAFLVFTAAIPTLALGKRLGNLVNWPAFSFTFVLMVLISVILAVTTAVPYKWWAFETDVMIGFYFNAWFGVPIEQTFLYLVTPWVAVLWLEAVHLWRFRELTAADPLGPGYPTVDLTARDQDFLPPEQP